jgi:hypothetical protein
MTEEILKLIKTHGLSFALMVGGLYFLNGKLTSAEMRLSALEGRLYDCYEQRLSSQGTPSEESSTPDDRQVFVIPENKRKS